VHHRALPEQHRSSQIDVSLFIYCSGHDLAKIKCADASKDATLMQSDLVVHAPACLSARQRSILRHLGPWPHSIRAVRLQPMAGGWR